MNKRPLPDSARPEVDFARLLPDGQEWFPVWKLARCWDVSVQHIINLVHEGQFTYENAGPVDFSSEHGKGRATMRIPRACILAFLKSHKL